VVGKGRGYIMLKKLQIQAICGFGVGTSTLLMMKLTTAFKEYGVDAHIFTGDVIIGPTVPCDVIFTSKELAGNVQRKAKCPVIVITNFVNQAEIKDKVKGFLDSNKEV
jgi:PTS system ascorbate-specific IIB component